MFYDSTVKESDVSIQCLLCERKVLRRNDLLVDEGTTYAK